ncbi:hypothetical protein FRC09_020564 [Ceratobasidium sp. 395]|nr:hypothetical protein FRC09_020564 [Ceratobasidium sp. 395]
MYLSSLDPFFPTAHNTGIENAKNTVRYIEIAGLRPGMAFPEFSAFYPILYLQSSPRDLGVLSNTKFVSGCIGLLRQYTEDIKNRGQGLLFHSFGFYCFRAMLVGIQVGILAQTGTLHTFIRDHQHLDSPYKVSRELSQTVSKLIMENWYKTMSLEQPLGPTTSHAGQRMLLESVGGFLDTDAEFLLEALWKDRDILTYVTARYPTDGWGTLLLLLGQHAISALELGNDDRYEWGHLRALCFRYSLSATPTENLYLRTICYDLRDFGRNSVRECLSFLVDEDDAENFLNAYISRLKSSPNQPSYPLEIAELFVDFLPQHRMLQPAHMMLPLVEALTSRVWQACGCRDLSTNPEFIKYSTGVFNTISTILEVHSNKPSITALAYSEDIFELAGRVVMSPLRYGSVLAYHLSQEDMAEWASENLQYWDGFLDSLFILASALPSQIRPGFSGPRRVWKKIWHNLSIRSTDDLLLEEIVEYLHECQLVWDNLGDALGYTSPGTVEQGQQCAYPRCPNTAQDLGTGYICEMCLQAAYCGKGCQERHWSEDLPDSHRDRCVGSSQNVSIKVPE